MARLPQILWMGIAGTIVGAVAMLPHVIHALDSGTATLDVAQFDEANLTSRNVTLKGVLDYDGLIKTSTKSRSGRVESVSHTTYYRLAPAVDVPGHEPTVLLLSNEGDLADATVQPANDFGLGAPAAEAPGVVTVTGVVRDVLWERFHWSLRGDFREAGLGDKLTNDLVVVEVTGRHSTSDEFWAMAGPVAGLLLGLLLGSRLGAAPPLPGAA